MLEIQSNPDDQSLKDKVSELARVHIFYSENLAHSDIKDRTLAEFQLAA